ncbi:MAG TPA: 5-formyltetrahydrofolate cyclo-ligase [Armatimonadota bacterium]|jgi:5,10-methenyltetrahydrofolate synthetase/dihydroneopterin aldolase
MSMNVKPFKAELRAALRARRRQLPPAAAQEASARITEAAGDLPLFRVATVICSYLTAQNEVDTEALIGLALAQGKRVILPRTILAEHRLALHEVTNLDDLLPGPYGIREPAPELPEIDPAEVELFFVPGLAFDAAGNRLGYGAGLYDSLLVMSEGWRVALAYGFQLLPRVPVVEHDMPMDIVITELGTVDCGQGQLATDHLRLRNMVFYGHHGAFPQERAQGIRLALDIDMRLDLQVPGLTDDLATTVNYPEVYRLIDLLQSGREFSLFEALAEQIAGAILAQFPTVAEVTVTARKFHPPVGGLLDAFEVEVTRSRPAWLG